MVRILSDLHFGNRSSLVRDLRQLVPLLEGTEKVIFNGDSVEMLFFEDRPKGAANAKALTEICRQAGTEPVFLTGNHDPILTTLHHLELGEGKIFVTHGDILFHGLSPWGHEAPLLRAAHSRELAALKQPASLEEELQAMRRAALVLEGMGKELRANVKPGIAHVILRHLWPPWRPLHILNGWLRTPSLANALVSRHAAHAQFVVIGHTHFSGVWKVGRRVVINTGAFLPLSHSLAVDLKGSTLSVQEIVTENRVFRLGRKIAHYEFNQ